MFTIYKPPTLIAAAASEHEPSYSSPADPYAHKRTLKNVLPKRGFAYLSDEQAFDDITTRNIVLDAMRNYSGIVHNITPRLVDGLLEQLLLSITGRMAVVASWGSNCVFVAMQKQKIVPWVSEPGITSDIIDRLLTHLLKARLRAIAALKRDADEPCAERAKKVELCKTAVAIDEYIKRLGETGLAARIPVLAQEEDDNLDERRTMDLDAKPTPRLADFTTDNWREVLSPAKTDADRAAMEGKDKLATEKAESSVTASANKNVAAGPRGTKRRPTDEDEEVNTADDIFSGLEDGMSMLTLKVTKRQVVDFNDHESQYYATKVAVEDFEELAAQIRRLKIAAKDNKAVQEVEGGVEAGGADKSETEVSEYNSQSDEDW